jgi:hypothetical protein
MASTCSLSRAREFGLARIHLDALHDLKRNLTLDHKCNPQW